MLYFAYGSNLNHFQMKRRCKDSIFIKSLNSKVTNLTLEANIELRILRRKKTQ